MLKTFMTIKLKKKKHIAWIILDRPDKLNAINTIMLQELSDALDNIEKDANVRCVIITGGVEKAFSAGADLIELQKLAPETAAEFSVRGQEVFCKLERLSKPVIAAIGGYALGGGLELALACDFRIATERVELGFPEIKLGLIPAWGGTQRLPLTVGLSNSKRLIMLGDRVQADEAYKMGLIDKAVPSEELEGDVEELAKRLCKCPQVAALKYTKYAVNSGIQGLLDSGLKNEREFFALLFSIEETRKKIEDFRSKRNKK